MMIRQEYKTVTIYEVYKGSKCLGKGTVVELAEKFGKNKTTIYGWGRQSKKPIVELVEQNITYAIKVGKRRVKIDVYRKSRPGFKLEEAELEEFEEEQRQFESKEDRRLRRNIRAQMAIENMRKDDSVFK